MFRRASLMMQAETLHGEKEPGQNVINSALPHPPFSRTSPWSYSLITNEGHSRIPQLILVSAVPCKLHARFRLRRGSYEISQYIRMYEHTCLSLASGHSGLWWYSWLTVPSLFKKSHHSMFILNKSKESHKRSSCLNTVKRLHSYTPHISQCQAPRNPSWVDGSKHFPTKEYECCQPWGGNPSEDTGSF